MKKRLLSLTLAVVLCLGLVVPTLAVDVSGLNTEGADAYARKLAEYIDHSCYVYGAYVACADLRDMDGDKVPEMIVITVPRENTGNQVVTVDIWQLKSGTAVKVNTGEFMGEQNDLIGYSTKGGKTYLNIQTFFRRQGVFGDSSDYLGTDGFHERLVNYGDSNIGKDEYTWTPNGGTYTEITAQQFEQYRSNYKNEADFLVSGGGMSWYVEETNHPSCENLRKQLAAKAVEVPVNTPTVPTTGSYGPYTISGSQYSTAFSVSFASAKVEKATVQCRTQWYIDGTVVQTEPYYDVDATLITLKAESDISISFSDDGEIPGAQSNLIQDGVGKYTYRPAALTVGEDFNMGFLSHTENDLKDNLQSGPVRLILNGSTYIVAYETASVPSSPTPPTSTSTTSFRDVPSNAYYAAPVAWAVSNNITNGTSTTAFSPDRTCTTAEILTFLYRACGEPYQPWENNPYTNVSSSDYYFQAALWAAKMGMVSGSTFPAGTPCSRANAVKFIWQAVGSPNPATTARFSDVASNASYARAVSWAVGAGVTNGTSTTTFSPNDTCTRGQIVTFLYRAAA